MVTTKSQRADSIYRRLFEEMLSDLECEFPSLGRSLRRDLAVLNSRFDKEGLSFLTVTCPKLGKAIIRSLETGQLEVPCEFKRAHGHRGIPAFLQGLLSMVYDSSGALLTDANWVSESRSTEDPDHNCIENAHVRAVFWAQQLLFAFYKLEVPFTRTQEREVLADFVSAEEDLRKLVFDGPTLNLLSFAKLIVSDLFDGFDPKDILPRHGPGAVATGEKLEKKWRFSRLYSGVEQYYPFHEYFMEAGSLDLSERMKYYRSLTRLDDATAKVVLVPKDSRKPRLISCEPLEIQWAQQGLGRAMVKWLERHKLTKGHINFRSQEINRQLALQSSKDRRHSTLDMKEASDRVSLALLREIIPDELLRALLAVRSSATLFPDGRVITLAKYAPMGSACCFPVEALCFWAISVAALCVDEGLRLADAHGRVKVYGDDLVCPSESFDVVTTALEACGLLVNRQKSFRNGFFRESCGMDAYRGVPVAPVKLKTLWSGRSTDADSLSSYCAYANDFAARGLNGTAQLIWDMLRSVFGAMPWGTKTSPYPCIIVESSIRAMVWNSNAGFRVRFRESTQEVQVRTRFTCPRKRESVLDGWPRLLQSLVNNQEESDPSVVVVPRTTKIKTGWRRI